MRIVYGVSGEGLGHVFEAIEIASYLQRHGHTVRLLTYGDRACDALREFQPTRIEGFPLYFTERGLSLYQTTVKNLPTLTFFAKHWRRLRRELAAFEPDIFLTAYEPYTTLIAHRLRKPLISMDNQSALLYLKDPPRGYAFSFHVAKLATRLVTVGASAYIVKSLRPAPPAPKHVRFVAPLVQREIRSAQPTAGDHVLVYLTKPHAGVLDVLRTIDERFYVYCCDRVGEDGNLVFRSRGGTYVQDLASCKAIVGTTGFSLIADAVYLKKPYFGVPLKGQFEQTLNALFLTESQLGDYSEAPTADQIRSFLARVPEYRERLMSWRFNPAHQEETLRELLGEIEAGALGALPQSSYSKAGAFPP